MNVKKRLGNFLSKQVSLGEGSWVAPSATVVGEVSLGVQSSVWYQSVLRGDINYIEIGNFSNLQDGVIGHLSDNYPLIVGDYVTIGHGAVIHACRIEDECLVGMNATILDGAVIGRQSIIAAGAVVPSGLVVPEGSLVAGVPGKIKNLLSNEKRESLKGWAEKYIEVTKAHRDLILD